MEEKFWRVINKVANIGTILSFIPLVVVKLWEVSKAMDKVLFLELSLLTIFLVCLAYSIGYGIKQRKSKFSSLLNNHNSLEKKVNDLLSNFTQFQNLMNGTFNNLDMRIHDLLNKLQNHKEQGHGKE